MKGGRKKGVVAAVRRAAKKVRRGVTKAGRAIGKKVGKEALRRGVMATRRAADYGIKMVPYVGNAYSVADFGLKVARAKRKGNLKKFLAKNAAEGVAQVIAPQAFATYEGKKAAEGVRSAIMEGKGMIVARRRR